MRSALQVFVNNPPKRFIRLAIIAGKLGREVNMRFNIKALVISTTLPASLVMLALSIWSRLSVSFGSYFMQAYNSIHLHPFTTLDPALLWHEQIFGVIFDVVYKAVDIAFLSGVVGLLYNWIAAKTGDEQPPA